MPYSLPSDTRYILYEETDLAQLKQKPCHFKCGIYLICTHGQALISTGVQQYIFEEQTELIFLTGSLIQVVQSSYDFKARILMFPQEVFLKAVLPIDTPYYNYTHEHPCYHHTEDERSQKTWKEINLWMDMAQMQFMDNTPQFRQQQEYNFLQSLLMWLFNTIQEKLAVKKQYSRKQILYYQFLQLVREYSTREHQVAFYADKLCITPQFRQQQEYNFLQSLLMWLFNTIQEKLAVKKQYSRKQILYYQFLQLVREYSTREHQVAFYADKLCITSRYLNEIIALYVNGRTPKQLIDEQLTAEIKVLLDDPHLSVTEIAQHFNFPDQSYLSRFFKKNTGMSPKEFRSQAR